MFDAYRNEYLALESILADLTPQRRKAPGQKGEQDGDWFKRALLATGVDLALLWASVVGCQTQRDASDATLVGIARMATPRHRR